ncbi:MAG: Zn-dependent peptidase [Edafosvirus sp.]|uniref:Zn-dependent peptidase n=1 Tax=Edafosvirus sp. TaxID=2487765 RepID=A0A3G4ZXD2_9VIRU|nr:MAG: Zn-dependent peptidase [Edafosvirus sp.]
MEIIKSKFDKRNYKLIILPNNLETILISDPETDISALALSVKVGYFHDDKDMPGISHFLEHMLFMGSEKYKGENYYHEYINQYGGTSNAFTASNKTCYYFSIPSAHFENMMDIFAQFFIKPLFDNDSLNREISAVDAEHKKNLHLDEWRYHNMFKISAKKSHPYSKFGTGNMETLKKPNSRDKLIEYYNKYYSANNMKLVILGKDPINVLEKMAIKTFGNILNKNIKIDDNYGYIFNDLPKVVQLVPIIKENRLIIGWQIPSDDLYLNYKPIEYISHLLGGEYRKSIYEYLKNKNWAKNLIVNCEKDIGNIYLLTINVHMTDEGFKNYNKIISTIYHFIEIIREKGITKKNYDNYKKISEIRFMYAEKEDPMDYVVKIATTMCINGIDMHKVIAINSLFHDYNEEFVRIVNNYLDYLKQQNSIIIIGSSKYNGMTSHIEKWYGIHYNLFNTILKQKSHGNELQYNKQNITELCEENPFIPNNFILKTCDNIHNNPIKLMSDKKIEIWYKFDNSFRIPYAYIGCSCEIPKICNNLKTFVIAKLYFKLFKYNMNVFFYLSGIVGYDISLNINRNTIFFSFYGFNDKLNIIVKTFIDNFCNIGELNDINQSHIFDVIKKEYREELENSIFISPYLKITNIFNKNICNSFYDSDDQLKIIDMITLNDILKFPKKLLAVDKNIKCLIQGNLLKNDAHEIKTYISYLIKNISDNQHNKMYEGLITHDLDIGSTKYIMKKQENEKEINSVIGMIVRIGYIQNDIKMLCLLELINAIITEPFFTQLRTVEQTGYIVKSEIQEFGELNNSLYVHTLVVQSPTKNPSELEKRINLFINEFQKTLLSMKENQFNIHKKSIINNLNKADTKLLDSVAQNMQAIINHNADHEGLFDMKSKMIKEFDVITKNELIEFYNNMYVNQKTRTLWVVGQEGSHT